MQKKTSRLVRAGFLALALIMAAAMFVGCSAKNVNPTVMKVGDVNISYSAYKDAYYACYQAYKGYSLYNVSTAEKFKEFQDIVFDYIGEYALTAYYAKQAGVELDEADLATVETQISSYVSGAMAGYATQASEELGANADSAALLQKEMELFTKALYSSTGMQYDAFISDLRESYKIKQLSEKYKAMLVVDANVPEEDISSYYDALVTQDTEKYATSPSQYYTDYANFLQNGGIRPLVAPEGYGYYKHVYIADPVEGEEKDSEALVAAALAKLAEGAEFDVVIGLYNEDEGMNSVPYKDEGFMVSEYNRDVYLDEFVDACLALENVGDVSEPVKTATGTHIIKKIGTVSTDPIPFEDVRDDLYNELLYLAQLKIYKDQVAAWKETAEIKKYYDKVTGYML